MDTKKLFATFAILMLALGIAGFAYAHWTKTVTIDGEITTGNVDLIILRTQDDDNGIDPDYDKNVGDTVVQIDQQDPERLIVTITNAYPSYHVYIDLTVRNVGTIPVKLKEFIIDAPDCITVQIWDSIGEQIDPYSWGGTPDKYQKDYTMYVHVEQCAEKGATYTFTIELVYWNWNEVP
jgi:hypothetical protein